MEGRCSQRSARGQHTCLTRDCRQYYYDHYSGERIGGSHRLARRIPPFENRIGARLNILPWVRRYKSGALAEASTLWVRRNVHRKGGGVLYTLGNLQSAAEA